MAQQKLTNYLRTFRKRSHLSQDEVAYLLGSGSGSKISRYERFARVPTLQTAMALEVIFGVPIHELFAGMFNQVESHTRRRAHHLVRRFDRIGSNRLAVIDLKILKRLIADQVKAEVNE